MNHWYPLRHELPRRHQHAGDVRLCRPIGRRLVALCRAGKAASAVGLAAARLRARLGTAAAPAELAPRSSMRTPTSGATRRSDVEEILSPTAPPGRWDGAMIDYNVRAERMGWLPSAPQLEQNPLTVCEKRRRPQASTPKDYVRSGLKSGAVEMSCEDPDDPEQLAAQHVRVALQSARLIGQGSRVFSQASARHEPWRARQGLGRDRPQETAGSRRGTTRRRKENSICW